MKRFSSQLIITNTSAPLKRAVITTNDDGTILDISETGGNLKEKHSTEFHNGIIIPGFVNCHCHLELSHMKGSINKGSGLGGFVTQIPNTRGHKSDYISSAALSADKLMEKEGIVLCADICNTTLSFSIKKESRIKYISLLEVFGIDPEKAGKRMNEITQVAKTAEEMALPYWLVPHSVYSMSLSLFKLLRKKNDHNKITSIHFMETEGEKDFIGNHSGSLINTYELSGFIPPLLETVQNHTDAVLNEITQNGNLILVHNTFADRETISNIRQRGNLFWCLCPNSNLYIEDSLPPLDLFIREGCDLVIGTDSLASNDHLSILEELKTLQFHFPQITIEEMTRWATVNGARALGEENNYGKLEPGKKPGLLLLENVDLINMKLLPESIVTRLI